MQENIPFISVIIPTCDRPQTLVDAIAAILANDYPPTHYEVIVVDQGADDKTKNAVQKHYGQNEKVIYLHTPVKCCSSARNLGMQQAKGDILAFTDDDATVDKNWLAAYAAVFTSPINTGGDDSTIAYAGGRIIPVYQDNRPTWLPPQREYLLPAFDLGGELRPFPENSQPIGVNLAIRRAILEEFGGFDKRLGLKNDAEIPYITGEDTLLGQQVRQAGYTVYYQPAAIVCHPVTPQRSTRRFFLRRNFREGVTFLAVENVRHQLSKKELNNHIRRQVKRSCWHTLLFLKNICIPKPGWSKAYMLSLSHLAFSAGVIHYARYIRKKHAT